MSVSARAYLGTSEILTTLMLNYIAGFIITYLIFNSDSFWRDLFTAFARSYPIGKVLPARGNWPAVHIGEVVVPLGLLLGVMFPGCRKELSRCVACML